MNYEKIDRAIELQNRADAELNTYGDFSPATANELLELLESMTPEEVDMVYTEYWGAKEK